MSESAKTIRLGYGRAELSRRPDEGTCRSMAERCHLNMTEFAEETQTWGLEKIYVVRVQGDDNDIADFEKMLVEKHGDRLR